MSTFREGEAEAIEVADTEKSGSKKRFLGEAIRGLSFGTNEEEERSSLRE